MVSGAVPGQYQPWKTFWDDCKGCKQNQGQNSHISYFKILDELFFQQLVKSVLVDL